MRKVSSHIRLSAWKLYFLRESRMDDWTQAMILVTVICPCCTKPQVWQRSTQNYLRRSYWAKNTWNIPGGSQQQQEESCGSGSEWGTWALPLRSDSEVMLSFTLETAVQEATLSRAPPDCHPAPAPPVFCYPLCQWWYVTPPRPGDMALRTRNEWETEEEMEGGFCAFHIWAELEWPLSGQLWRARAIHIPQFRGRWINAEQRSFPAPTHAKDALLKALPFVIPVRFTHSLT